MLLALETKLACVELGSYRHSMPSYNHCNVHGDVVPETQIALWYHSETCLSTYSFSLKPVRGQTF